MYQLGTRNIGGGLCNVYIRNVSIYIYIRIVFIETIPRLDACDKKLWFLK